MNGQEIVKVIEGELFFKDISKTEFYKACGLNSATMSNWRNGVFQPSQSKLHIIEDYLGIKFEDYETDKTSASSITEEEEDLLESIRNRQDLRILLRSARDTPPSSVYEIVSQLEKMKENVN